MLAKMLPYLKGKWGNPSSRDHAFGWDAQEAVEAARMEAAALINALPNEIVFTSCATESIHLGLHGLFPVHASISTGFVTSSVEHEAIRASCKALRERGRTLKTLPVDSQGRLDPATVERALISQSTKVLSLMAANNETGVLFPIRACAAIAHAHGAIFFTDAAQALGKIPLDAAADGFDLAAFSAHKLGGPKGVGALYIKGGPGAIPLEPLFPGGGQEGGLRGGTLNVPGIVGFGEACRLAGLEMTQETSRLRSLRDHLEQSLLSRFTQIRINGSGSERLANTSNLCFPGIDARALIRDMHDVAVSTRSACSSGSSEPSHVLKAMGLSDEDAFASIRFSLGKSNTKEEIDLVIEKVSMSYAKLLGMGNPI